MLVNLKVQGKSVVLVGGGEEAFKKVARFIEEGAQVRVVSRSFSAAFSRQQEKGHVTLETVDVKDAESFIRNLNPKPVVLMAATDNSNLNAKLAVHAKHAGCLAYAIDHPELSDFSFPALARIDDVCVAVSTGGESPAFASLLRQRVEKFITREDLLKIKLQAQLRSWLKQHVHDFETRRAILYEVLEDEETNRRLKAGNFALAWERATAYAAIASKHKSSSPDSKKTSFRGLNG